MAKAWIVLIESALGWLLIFGCLYYVNPGKAIFPASLATLALGVSAWIKKNTITDTLKRMSLRWVVLGTSFLLVIVNPFHDGWRDSFYVVFIVPAIMVLVASITDYLKQRIEKEKNNFRGHS